NVTSDNVSPIHLMDIKRVAFETKPVNTAAAKPMPPSPAPAHVRQSISREKVAELVDKFLSTKVVKQPQPVQDEQAPPRPESPVKTVIHELRPQSLTDNGFNAEPVDFVSENDVRDAIANGRKIYITKKTIVTPSARDLGDEKDVFATV